MSVARFLQIEQSRPMVLFSSFLLASILRVVVCDCAVLGAMCVFSMSSSNPPGRPISSTEIAKKGGILTRPSACGQAEGCG